MGLTTLTLPRLGETMEEARVTLWLVAPGAAFARGDVLLEVETDKTVVEVPALQAGVLHRQLVAPGETVALDQPIAEVAVEGEAAVAEPPVAPLVTLAPAAAVQAMHTPQPRAPGARPAASPRARAMARGAGLSLADVAGTGRGGRITGEDVARVVLLSASESGRVATPFGPLARRVLRPRGTALTPIVLIHGLFDDGRGWRDLPDRLCRAGHPVIVPDLPGHGDSPALVASLAEAEAALAACLPPSGPVVLAGHSVGAVLAVGLARRLGPRVERVVLSAPAGLGEHLAQAFVDGMMTAGTAEELGTALAMLGTGPVSDALLAAELARLQARRPAIQLLAAALAASGRQLVDMRADVARLVCPVSALFGLEDRVLHWTDCAALPPRAAIHLVRGAGHLPHLSDPLVFLQLLGAAEGHAATRAPLRRGGG